eukprot:11254548-Alexandrium_andersonii.AAC.1
MVLARQDTVATVGAPQTGRPVGRGREDLAAVRGEDPELDPAGVPPKSMDAMARRGVPDLG